MDAIYALPLYARIIIAALFLLVSGIMSGFAYLYAYEFWCIVKEHGWEEVGRRIRDGVNGE